MAVCLFTETKPIQNTIIMYQKSMQNLKVILKKKTIEKAQSERGTIIYIPVTQEKLKRKRKKQWKRRSLKEETHMSSKKVCLDHVLLFYCP